MYLEGEDLNDPSRNPPNGSPGDAGRSGGVFGRVGLHDGADLGEIPWNKLRVLKAWNSFTALGPKTSTPLASITLPSTRQPLFTPGDAALDLSAIRPAFIGDVTRARRWLMSSQPISSTPTAFNRSQHPPFYSRFLLLRRFHY
jgi:hypothetical protein